MRVSYDEEMEMKLREMSRQAGKKRVDWKTDFERMNEASRKKISISVVWREKILFFLWS